MSFSLLLFNLLICLFLGEFCIGRPIPEETLESPTESLANVLESEARAGGTNANGFGTALNGLQSGFSTLTSNANMKDAKLVMGGFSFIIMPSPDLSQLAQLNPSQLNPAQLSSLPGQLPSLPGK